MGRAADEAVLQLKIGTKKCKSNPIFFTHYLDFQGILFSVLDKNKLLKLLRKTCKKILLKFFLKHLKIILPGLLIQHCHTVASLLHLFSQLRGS